MMKRQLDYHTGLYQNGGGEGNPPTDGTNGQRPGGSMIQPELINAPIEMLQSK